MLLHQLRRDSGSQQLPQVLLPGLPVQTGTAETRGSPAFKLKQKHLKGQTYQGENRNLITQYSVSVGDEGQGPLQHGDCWGREIIGN